MWFCEGLLDEGCLEQLIPCPYCLEAKQDEHPRTFQDVHMFSLIECAKTILASQSTSALTIRCSKCNSPQIHLKFLVPDLLLLDLPKHLHIDASDLDYNPTADILGQGGEGTVFRGKYHGQQVAIKQNAIIQSCQTLEESMRAKSDSNDSFQMVTSGQSDLLISDFFWKSKVSLWSFMWSFIGHFHGHLCGHLLVVCVVIYVVIYVVLISLILI